MREAFEKWYGETWGKYEMGKPEHIFDIAWNGDYCRMNVRLAWSAWQTAHVDILEKLKPCEFDTLRWNENEQQYDETTAVKMSDIHEVLNDNH